MKTSPSHAHVITGSLLLLAGSGLMGACGEGVARLSVAKQADTTLAPLPTRVQNGEGGAAAPATPDTAPDAVAPSDGGTGTKPSPDLSAFENLTNSAIFQHRGYTFDSSSALICGDAGTGILPLAKVRNTIASYLEESPEALSLAVKVLTFHTNPKTLQRIEKFRKDCARNESPNRCLLSKYWANSLGLEGEEASLRVLALFLDKGIRVQRSNADDFAAFNVDQIRAIEKTVRKLPRTLIRKMGRGQPSLGVDKFVVNGHTPLTIYADSENDGQLGQTLKDKNALAFSPKELDKARSGKMYKDVGYLFRADFRLQMLLHEIGHLADSYAGESPFTSTAEVAALLDASTQALWPSHWWDAFEGSNGIKGGRNSRTRGDKFAEIFAQYVLQPHALAASAPEAYAWMSANVFVTADGSPVEYEGYENCDPAVSRPLNVGEKALAPTLNSKN